MSSVIGRNIVSLALSRITSGVLLFFVIAKLAAYLGPEEFGKFSLVLAYYTIFLLFADFGISRFVIRKISEDKNLAGVYLGNFLLAQFLLSLVVFAAFLILPKIFNYDSVVTQAMLYTGFGVALGAMSIPFATIIQAWQKIHWLAAIYFIDSLIRAVWLILAIYWGKGLVFIFSVYILNGLLDIALYYFFTRKLTRPSFALRPRLVQRLFLFGIPFAFVSGFEILIAKIDIVIQKVFLPFAEVGYYSAAYRYLDFLTFVPAVVAISLFPFLSEIKDLKTPETAKVLNRINRFMVAMALPLGVAGTIFAEKIVLTLFGPEYKPSVILFQILIWSTALTFLYAVPNVIMQVKKTRVAVYVLAVAAAFNTAANILLVPRYGVLASAWITVGTYLLVMIVYAIYARREATFQFMSHAAIPAFGTVILALATRPFRNQHIFIILLLSLVIYFGFLGLVGFFKKEDLRFPR